MGAPSVVAVNRQLGKARNMTFHQELVRFDAVVAQVVPEAVPSMGSGLNDEGIRALRTMVAPLDLGEEIEQLYRWHDGSALSVFGGKRLLSAAEIIQDREFQLHALERPPAWLQFTDGPEYYFATLDVPGCETDPTVWSGNTHDVWLCRMHDSLESMIGSLSDAGLDPSVSLSERSPGSFTFPDPPPGT